MDSKDANTDSSAISNQNVVDDTLLTHDFERPDEIQNAAKNETYKDEECLKTTNQSSENNKTTFTAAKKSKEPLNISPKCVQNKSQAEQPFPSAAGTPKQHLDSFYHIKWISFNGKKTAIVTQNENGPCPLLALFNVLLLGHKVQLPAALTVISSTKMLDHIGEIMWGCIPTNLSETEKSNYDQNVSDAINIFPKLQTGLDVNVNFTSVQAFEYTPELTVFDLLRIPIYHGWVLDPQDAVTSTAIGGCSYNQLVEKIIGSKSSEDQALVNEGILAEEFLNSTASQLTYYGISLLLETMSEGGLAVMFRNNHFSAIHRRKDELFTLVTDCGFLREDNVIWETLASVQGDSHFVDSNFHTAPLKSDVQSIETCPANLDTAEQIDYDYQVALSLQQDQVPGSSNISQEPQQLSADQLDDASYQLAVQLQKEEEERATQQQLANEQATSHRPASSPPIHSAAARQRPHTAPSNTQKDSCSLL